MPPAVAGPTFPRAPLLGAAFLVALALLTTLVVRVTGVDVREPASPTAAVATRALLFEDRDDGSVAVIDPRTKEAVAILPGGTNGFLRATLRGLARERKARDLGPEIPFALTRWGDGRLSLDDPATGSSVVLDAFGSTNVAAFAPLLTAGAQR